MSGEDKPAIWTGRLERGEAPGTVTGWMEDQWGWRVAITGTLDTVNGGYTLEGVLGPAPESLRIGVIDDPPTKDG